MVAVHEHGPAKAWALGQAVDPSDRVLVLRVQLTHGLERGIQVTTPLIAKLLFAFGPVDATRKPDLLQTLRARPSGDLRLRRRRNYSLVGEFLQRRICVAMQQDSATATGSLAGIMTRPDSGDGPVSD